MKKRYSFYTSNENNVDIEHLLNSLGNFSDTNTRKVEHMFGKTIYANLTEDELMIAKLVSPSMDFKLVRKQ